MSGMESFDANATQLLRPALLRRRTMQPVGVTCMGTTLTAIIFGASISPVGCRYLEISITVNSFRDCVDSWFRERPRWL